MSNDADQSPRPWRSALYLPGANVRAMDKARTFDADVTLPPKNVLHS